MNADTVFILAAIFGILYYAFHFWDRIKLFLVNKIRLIPLFSSPDVPNESLRVVPNDVLNNWSVTTTDNKPSAFLEARFFVTNISKAPSQVTRVHIKRPNTPGFFTLQRPDQTIWGNLNVIPPSDTWQMMVFFGMRNQKIKFGSDFKCDIVVYDKFANRIKIKDVIFRHDQRRDLPKKN